MTREAPKPVSKKVIRSGHKTQPLKNFSWTPGRTNIFPGSYGTDEQVSDT